MAISQPGLGRLLTAATQVTEVSTGTLAALCAILRWTSNSSATVERTLGLQGPEKGAERPIPKVAVRFRLLENGV